MKSELINLFAKIREIPLRNPEFVADEDNRCWGKHRKLKKLLENKGYKVRYRIVSFKWAEQRFPKEILAIPHREEDYHLFLEININNKWTIIDASNDAKLPDYNDWDGETDCKISLKYKKLFSPSESKIIEAEERGKFNELYKENKDFYIAVNKFFQSIRK